MAPKPRGLDLSLVVLLAAALVAYLRGPLAAAWFLAWVWAALMALVALTVGVLATLRPGARVTVQLGQSGRVGAWWLAVWGLATALAFAALALSRGAPLLWLPALSLAVVVFPGSGALLLDEYVQTLLARGAALAGGVALFALLPLALVGGSGLEVAFGGLACYVLVLEAYVARALGG